MSKRVSTADMLRNRIRSKQAVLGVIGLGYVGLPLAVAFAEAGFRVLGFDVSENVASGINSGVSHVKDVSSETLQHLIKHEMLSATTDSRYLKDADIVSICVPTPLGKTRDPDISFVQQATEAVASQLRAGQMVILESTTYPGTTREVILPQLEQTGLTVGEDFFLAFSPERIDPGNRHYTIVNTPKVIGGVDPDSTDLGTLFYESAIEHVHPVSSPEVAEMVKLHENTFRAVNIALANETSIMCELLNIDVWEVIEAARTKPFGFMPFYPGPGIGGHCIPLDPHYLSWKMRTIDYRARFIELATEINGSMPRFWVGKVTQALNERALSVNGARILVIGVSYKPDIDDVRESPAIDIVTTLKSLGADVSYHDPYVAEFLEMASVPLDRGTVEDADVVLIVTNHQAVDFDFVRESASLLVDTRSGQRQ